MSEVNVDASLLRDGGANLGLSMEEARIREVLDACLLKDQEFQQGPEIWASHEDPFPEIELEQEVDAEEASMQGTRE